MIKLSSLSCMFAMTFLLTGCIGTYLAQREVDIEQPYPSLHSVPDRPPKIDFTKSEQVLEDLEEDQEKKMHLNEEIRESTHPVTRPEMD